MLLVLTWTNWASFSKSRALCGRQKDDVTAQLNIHPCEHSQLFVNVRKFFQLRKDTRDHRRPNGGAGSDVKQEFSRSFSLSVCTPRPPGPRGPHRSITHCWFKVLPVAQGQLCNHTVQQSDSQACRGSSGPAESTGAVLSTLLLQTG